MSDSIAFYRTDRWGTPRGRIEQISSVKRTRKTTGTDTITMVCETQMIKGDRIVFQDFRGIVHEYIITDLQQARTTALEFTYYATNSVQELALTFIEDKRVRSGNSSQALTRLLEDTRWTVGRVDVGLTDKTDISFYHISALKALQDTCDKFGLEPVTELTMNADHTGIATRSLSLLAHQGDTNRRRFTFGRNLVDVTRKIDATDVYTRLYPYGKGVESTDADGNATGGYGRKLNIADVNNGLTYIQDDTATETWGLPGPDGHKVPAATSYDFPDTTDANELLKQGKAKLAELVTPKVSYTATIAVLGVEGESRQGIGLGDDVQIIDESFPEPLRVDGRVLQIDDDMLQPLSADTKITLGNLVDTYTNRNQQIANKVDSLWNAANAWNDAATLQTPYIDEVINGLNNQMNKTGGYVYLEPGTGITVYDKPKTDNPTMAIQLGGGFFRIADSKKSDGTWDWRTMGTGAGLVADIIVAGVIRGGNSYWNLETGEILFNRGSISDAKNNTSWDLTTGDFTTNGTINGGTIIGTEINGTTITGGTINASKLNAPTVNGGSIDQSDITSSSGSQKVNMSSGILEFYRNGSKVGEISATTGGISIEYGSGYGINMSSGGTSIRDNSGSTIALGTGGFSVVDPSSNRIELGTQGCSILTDRASLRMGESGFSMGTGETQMDMGSSGLSITTSYGHVRMGSGGISFQNDQGWGFSLSAAGMSIEWAGNHRLATGHEAGALYIDGKKITTA